MSSEDDGVGLTAIIALNDAYAQSVDQYCMPGLFDDPEPEGDLPASVPFSRLLTNRELYHAVLGMIVSGASLRAAFGTVGILAPLVTKWIQRGVQDLTNDKDTYLARFATDLYRVRQAARADSEMKVKSSNPVGWLRNDAKAKEWDDDPQSLPQVRAEDHLEQAGTDVVKEGAQEGPVQLDNKMIMQMIQALQTAGAVPKQDTQGPVVEAE